MRGVDGPVFLTRAAPAGVYSGCLLMYDVIDELLVSRSGVLRCIVDAGGGTSLPSSVALSDFNVWRRAGPARRSAFLKMGMRAVLTVMKVADALDDCQLAAWVTQLAEHLVALGSSPSPPSPSVLRHISKGMSDLPDHLLCKIFSAVSSYESGVEHVLTVAPRHLHRAVIAATISRERKLDACFASSSIMYLKALTSLPSSPPSVLSLRVQYMTSSLDDESAAEAAVFTLSNALRHHSGLQHLAFDRCCAATRSAVHLPPAVATLSSLQSFSLGSPDDCCSIQELHEWQPTLRSLPQLRGITLNVEHVQSSLKRQRNISCTPATLTKPVCLASTFSASGSLTSLALNIKPHSSSPCLLPLTATAPLILPHLSHLTLSGSWLSTAGPLLHHLQAPLTSLTLTKLTSAFLTSRATQPDPAPLYRSLAKFTRLHTLFFHVPMCVRLATTGSWWEELVVDACAGLRRLPALRDLRIRAGVRTLHRIIPAALAAPTALRRLQLACCCSGHGHGCVPGWAEWSTFLESLSVPTLEDLRIWMPHVPCDHIPGVCRLLSGVSALTCLRLTGYDNCFATPDDIAALAQLTRLHHLSIHEFSVPSAQHGALAQALLQLRSLTLLSLTGGDLGDGFAGAFAAAAAALSKLQQLRVGLGACITAPFALVRVAAALPSRPELVLYEGEAMGGGGGDGGCDGTSAAAEGPSLPVLELEGAAEELGVRLVCCTGPELRTQCP
eukprot:jgi/Ulvmu1/3542/UM164_0008.1